MIKLFQQTFSLEGRKNPASRPTMEQWYEVLLGASKAMVHCTNPNCQTAFLSHNQHVIYVKRQSHHFISRVRMIYST